MNTPAALHGTLEPTPRTLASGPASWSLLLLTAVMGSALAVTTWFGSAAAREASTSLVRGQGDGLVREMRRELRDSPLRPPSPEQLERLVGADEEGEAGVTFALVLDPLTGRTSQAGRSRIGVERVRKEALAARRSGRLLVLEDVALLVKRLPPGPAQRARHPDTLVPSEELNRIAIEFSPDAAERLQSAASRTLAVGAIATLVLLLTSIAFARLLRYRARLEHDLAAKRQLAALGEVSVVLAHEIRNPLASLKGHAQLLAESLDGESPALKKTERIVTEAVRLEELCSNLLDFVRSAQVSPAPTSVAELLRRCAEAVPEGRVELSLGQAPPTWNLDAPRMEHVVVNLLRNAAQASPPETPVELEAKVVDGELLLVVRDRGPGLPPGQEEQVFQPFHTTRTRGTGLGLAVARRVVELHGGVITARTHPAGGAELSVRIPESAV